MGVQQKPDGPDAHRITTGLRFRDRIIGTVTLFRESGGGFNSQEQGALDHIGAAIAPAVQAGRLYLHARRQAHQLQQISRLQADAEPSDELRNEFLADIAHSFRNPLTTIKGFSSTLLQSDVDWSPEMNREFIRLIDQETDRLSQVVSDLLVPPIKDMDVVELRREETTMERLFAEARSQLVVARPSLTVEFASEPSMPALLVDTSRLARVICYLAAAAQRLNCGGVMVKATPRNGQPLVSIGPLGTGGGASNGPQSHGEDSLQLEICRTVLETHGQMLGEGSWDQDAGSFWFSLPVAPVNR